MWPFNSKKNRIDAVLAIMDTATEFASEKWLLFCETLKFGDGVSLTDRIAFFMVPAEQGLQNNFPALRKVPGGIIALIVAKGIQRSGTHTTSEIEQALGATLPD